MPWPQLRPYDQFVQPDESAGLTRLRIAAAAFAVVAAGIVVLRKELLSHPWPGLVLVLTAAAPFLADARYPRLSRSRAPGG